MQGTVLYCTVHCTYVDRVDVRSLLDLRYYDAELVPFGSRAKRAEAPSFIRYTMAGFVRP